MINIERVTRLNWLYAIKLSVHPEQENFVSSVLFSLARAYIMPDGLPVTPFAVYKDKEMIGFFTIICNTESLDNYWFTGFMIDKKYQGKGYGKACLPAIINMIKKIFPRCKILWLTVNPKNTAALNLYQTSGFKDSGKICLGERVFFFEF